MGGKWQNKLTEGGKLGEKSCPRGIKLTILPPPVLLME